MFVAISTSTPPPHMEICVIIGVNNCNIIHIAFVSYRDTARKGFMFWRNTENERTQEENYHSEQEDKKETNQEGIKHIQMFQTVTMYVQVHT
jgi:hypothetical protein